MHVAPAKHSFGKCDRKVWQTDGQTDGRTDGRRTKWSLCVAMLRRWHKNYYLGYSGYKSMFIFCDIKMCRKNPKKNSIVLYKALNSPSLIFILERSETGLSSFEFTHYPLLLYNPLYTCIIQLAPNSEGEKGENKAGAKFPCIQYLLKIWRFVSVSFLVGGSLEVEMFCEVERIL